MKIRDIKLLCASLAMLATVFAVSHSSAAVILTIDISNPATATFTATGAFAQNDDIADTFLNEGFTLLRIFNSPATGGPGFFDTSTLFSPGGNFAYTNLFVVTISGEDRDLNIAGSGFSTQDFSVTAPALTGSATADLADWLPFLTAGVTGNIIAGDPIYSTVIIGQYQVIPEPGTALLAVGGCVLAFLLWQKRAKRRRSAGFLSVHPACRSRLSQFPPTR